ncbi:MAG: polysaccharide deacetylase family protein, partial [Candidatus Rokubacteria bacterium]|nr:polysaccharide deacetylase family protein [Candidatus Rokubacteria bacterium]
MAPGKARAAEGGRVVRQLPLWLLPGALWVGYAAGAHVFTLTAIRRGPRGAHRVALTFDDGPDPVNTPKVLDLLGDAGARATFFVVGERAASAPDVVREMVARGHEVGNHTWSHANLW